MSTIEQRRPTLAAVGFWLALLLALFCATPALGQGQGGPQASVDRALVGENDSLTLTIRRAGSGSRGEPDYSPLASDFHMFGSRQSNRSVVTNGRAESWTEWQVTLIPKRTGQLTIPSLTVNGERTEPIRIDVQPARATAGTTQRDPLFMEVSVDRERVYVEQQLLLTVRIFLALALEDMQLSDPEPEHARVEKVAQSNFRRDIDGITYQVHELVYAIFAEQPGELVIPELVFSGRQPLRSRSFFDFPGQGRSLRRMSPQISVTIKQIPSRFSGTHWLPARNLTLVESWNGNPEQLAAGDSMTRSLTLLADGLAAAQLPELPLPQIEGGRLYADQPQLDNSGDTRGLRGKRVESAALIPSQPGPLRIPGASVVWWDVDSDSEKVAEIPPRQLQIRPASATSPTTPATAPTPSSALTTVGDATINPQLLGWQLATALLACLWLATLWWGWRRARTLPVNPTRPEAEQANEYDAFKQLQASCRANNAAAARAALLNWGMARLQRKRIDLEALLAWADNDALQRAVDEMERHLYGGQNTSAWRGEALLAALSTVRGKRQGEPAGAGSQSLPPLYPGG